MSAATPPPVEPAPRRNSVPAILGLLLTLAAMGAVGYFAFYAPLRSGEPAAGPPEVVQGGGGAGEPSPPAPAAPRQE